MEERLHDLINEKTFEVFGEGVVSSVRLCGEMALMMMILEQN